MSHLWKIEDFLAEITHLQELCARRPGSTVVQTLLNTLCQRLQAVDTWASEAIIQLLDHVEKSTLPETEKATLNQCVESLATASNNHALTLAHGGQKVHNFPAYLTSQDWTLLHADVTVMDLLSVLAQRLAHMSVVSLKGHTKHQAVALILKIRNDQGKPAMTPHALHQLQKDFQALHKAANQGVAPGNGTYPPRPNDLGENWLQAAYGNDRPECRHISLAPWMKKAPVRNTNLLLQATQCRTNGDVPQDTVAQLAQALLPAQSHRQPQVTFATQAATSQQEVLNNRPAATPQALGLTNGPTEQALPLATEPAVPQQKGQPSSNTNGQTLEELEAQAYQAIAFKKKTKGMKRPKPKTKRAKLAELLQFSSNLPKHSQSALAAILDKAKKLGIKLKASSGDTNLCFHLAMVLADGAAAKQVWSSKGDSGIACAPSSSLKACAWQQ
ncbi:Uncharacterized protein SCF082_LOCUS6462 [Durusdinium trenchii]|uniref:Uncharacterized protein n=1 Tax=Durusdinium trenchii TaxID=1381693 RepID=A0ABP0IG69_9DINO